MAPPATATSRRRLPTLPSIRRPCLERGCRAQKFLSSEVCPCLPPPAAADAPASLPRRLCPESQAAARRHSARHPHHWQAGRRKHTSTRLMTRSSVGPCLRTCQWPGYPSATKSLPLPFLQARPSGTLEEFGRTSDRLSSAGSPSELPAQHISESAALYRPGTSRCPPPLGNPSLSPAAAARRPVAAVPTT